MSPAQDKSTIVMEKSSENSSEKGNEAEESKHSGILAGPGVESKVSSTSSFQVLEDPKD